jgi:hypothetical protein
VQSSRDQRPVCFSRSFVALTQRRLDAETPAHGLPSSLGRRTTLLKPNSASAGNYVGTVPAGGHPRGRSDKLVNMVQTISGTRLLDPAAIAEPYGFYEELRSDAPIWEVPGTGIFTVATYQLLAEAAARVEDFSSNLNCLLYQDARGMPCRLSFGDAGIQALATADPPMHALHRGTVFPALVAKRMAALEPEVVQIAEDCVSQGPSTKGLWTS